ncbi:hypothetical protein BC937DRAFT_94635 [Endogone sp. FLAS-F59071]|nr:hypothetical protein BC937DRAFT_94635 [Endogone sp. FLAS-F59071]|eukprot:RUS20679.1 hypothetical protein BC937DRAFT_94635 [Endogone sp. FLAS-F59071]
MRIATHRACRPLVALLILSIAILAIAAVPSHAAPNQFQSAEATPFVPSPRAFGASVLVESQIWYYGMEDLLVLCKANSRRCRNKETRGGAAPDPVTNLITDTSDLFVLPLTVNFTTSTPPFVSHNSDATLFGSLSPPQSSWQAASPGFDGTSFVVVGGYMEPNDTLLYSYNTLTHLWAKPLSGSSSTPPQRHREWSMAFNPVADNVAYIFGGGAVVNDPPAAAPSGLAAAKPDWSNELWSLDSSGVWTNLTAAANNTQDNTTTLWPLPTVDHTAHVLANGTMVVVGGRTNDGLMADLGKLWVFDTKAQTWETQTVSGQIPMSRAHHTSVMTEDGHIIIFGGASNWNATEFLNDVAVLDTSSWQWWIPTVSGTPPSVRWGHNADYLLGQMIVAFGVNPVSGQDNNIYILDTTSWAWTTSLNTAQGLPSFSPNSGTATPTISISIPISTTITTTSHVSASPIPQTKLTSTTIILSTSIGGTFVFFATAGAFFFYRRRRRAETSGGAKSPSFVIDRSSPGGRSTDSYGRSMASEPRKHLSWNLPPDHQSDSVVPPAPVAYADWATTVYRQASRRASWYYRDVESLAPLSEERIGLRAEEKAPESGPTVERVVIEEDVVDPEELYRHMEIQTIAVPKQVLYVVNRD